MVNSCYSTSSSGAMRHVEAVSHVSKSILDKREIEDLIVQGKGNGDGEQENWMWNLCHFRLKHLVQDFNSLQHWHSDPNNV